MILKRIAEEKKDLILVVDDQPNNLKVIANILSEEYSLIISQSGTKALKLLEKRLPDMILLDIMMPEMDGYEVCKTIKTDPKLNHIPVIFLSAKTDVADIVKGFESGAVDYITKPFNSLEVKTRVRNHLMIHHEVQNRKKAEQETREQAAVISSLLRAVPDIFFYKNLNGSFLGCNPEFEKFIGLNRSDIIGKTDFDLFDEQTATINIENDRRAKLINQARKNEEWITYPDKTRKLMETIRTPFKDSNGVTIGIMGISRDISDRHRMETTIKENEQRLNLILNKTPAVIYSYIKEFDNIKWLYVNNNISNLLGYIPQQLMHEPDFWQNCIHPDDKASLTEKQQKEENYYEYRVKDKEGNYHWISDRHRPVQKDNGKTEIIGAWFDITERKNAEQKLAETEKLLAQTSSLAKLGGYEFTYPGGNGKVDKTLKSIFELDENRTPSLENAFNYIKNPSIASEIKLLVEKTIKQGISFNQELEIITAKGNCKWIKLTGEAEFSAGTCRKLYGTVQDITEHRYKEDLEKEVAVSRKTLRFKQNLIASMSHEMRTPLSGILGSTQLLDNTLLDEKQRELLAIQAQSAEQLSIIIDQVLDYASLQIGKLNLELQEYKWKRLKKIIEGFFRSICHKPIEFSLKLDPALPEISVFDPGRIIQVIKNLLLNAIQFTSEGVIDVLIRPHKNQSTQNTDHSLIEIEISDTGEGIAEEKLETIFESFSDVHQIESDQYRGLGLGLSLCKSIVELHGGKIMITSQKGKGTNVFFTFKTDNNNHSTGNNTHETMPKNLKILLAEDKLTTQKVVKLILSSMGHQVSIANNGKETFTLFNPEEFDLILMDIQMPVMDGIAATKHIKSNFTDPPLIIGFSANIFQGDKEKYTALGMDGFLRKPLNKEAFIDLATALLAIRSS